METVITAKGRVFQTDMVSVIESPKRAYIRVMNATMAEVAAAFSDKSETAAIRYGDKVIRQFTRLVAIVPEQDAVKVILGKE